MLQPQDEQDYACAGDQLGRDRKPVDRDVRDVRGFDALDQPTHDRGGADPASVTQRGVKLEIKIYMHTTRRFGTLRRGGFFSCGVFDEEEAVDSDRWDSYVRFGCLCAP